MITLSSPPVDPTIPVELYLSHPTPRQTLQALSSVTLPYDHNLPAMPTLRIQPLPDAQDPKLDWRYGDVDHPEPRNPARILITIKPSLERHQLAVITLKHFGAYASYERGTGLIPRFETESPLYPHSWNMRSVLWLEIYLFLAAKRLDIIETNPSLNSLRTW